MKSTFTWLIHRLVLGIMVCSWGSWLGLIILGGSQMPLKPPQSSPWNCELRWSGREFTSFTLNSTDDRPTTVIDLNWGNGAWDCYRQPVSMDHIAFYTPANFIRDGRDHEIYTHTTIGPYQEALFPQGMFEGKLEAYRNPPFFALLHYPTARLPYAQSVWIWNLISFMGLLLGLWLLQPTRYWQALFWSMAFLPTFTVLTYGQTSLLSFPVFVGVYRLLKLERRFLAGVLASLLLFKPPLLLGLLVWWAWDFRRYRSAWLGGLLGGLLILALSHPIVPGAWKAFVIQLQDNVRFDNFEWWKSHNARAFWRLLLTPELAPLPGLLWLISAIVGVVMFVLITRKHARDVRVLFASSVGLMLWASPHTLIYEWVVALVPAILLWERFPEWHQKLRVLYAVSFIGLHISTDLGEWQNTLISNQTGWSQFPILQVSMICFTYTGVGLFRLLHRAPETPVGLPT
jgi:alpha-1,2-mannosyltransferase